MSDKARRSNSWDDQHLRGPILWPVRAVLKAFSSITLAVTLLVLVLFYGISASVPVGLLALAPTYLIYALIMLALVGVALIPAAITRRLLKDTTRAPRFIASFIILLLGLTAAAWIWVTLAWPRLRYDPFTGEGLRLFAGFVEQYKNVTVRRLPGMEMSELEYYAWWPLRWLLLAFVVNMVTATVRRIDFVFKNIGVLTVHTGIVVLALGSIYYAGLKQEGDTLLLAGAPDPRTGAPAVGPPQDAFYDNTRVALFVRPGLEAWEQRPLHNIPRYNDYNLSAASGESAWSVGGVRADTSSDHGRDLSIPIENPGNPTAPGSFSFRVVGYAAYAEPVNDWMKSRPPAGDPLRFVYLHSALPDDEGRVSDDPAYTFIFPPTAPADRITGNDVFSVEYTLGPGGGMPAQRWRDLSEPLPLNTSHAIVVDIPGAPPAASFHAVYPIQPGSAFTLGDTGYRIGIKQLAPTPPFPIITEGYKGAISSVAVVTVTPPTGQPYERYVYHRFPQINQDLLRELKANGQPKRRDADPAIRVSLIESDRIYVYIDEPAANGSARAIVRRPNGGVKVYESLAAAARFEMVDKVSLRLGDRWDAAMKIERPRSVPAAQQGKESIGTHDKAMLAVEVTQPSTHESHVVWLPFTKYVAVMTGSERRINFNDGSSVDMVFGRLQRPLPGFQLRLLDFEMIAYDHRGAPRDYQSIVRVVPTTAKFDLFDHITKLNNPLQAPFHWDERRNTLENLPGRLVAGMSPFQFKFSQAGWDQQGWARTQQQTDAGQLPRPFASFTILGVGNNPGIHLVAAGGVMMGLGIPWAFYVKPWLVRREKARIQREVAAGTYVKPQPRPVRPAGEAATAAR